jgi:hypothetical protein
MRVLATGTVALMLAAMPASAQIAGSMRGLSGSSGPSIRGTIVRPTAADPGLGSGLSMAREVRDIRGQIADGLAAGQLSRGDARALRREGYRIDAMRDRFRRGGYSEAEVAMLRSRSEALRSAVVAKRSQGLAK